MLALLPALIGAAAWEPLADLAGASWGPDGSAFWIWYWHPPLMDVLFGILVLAPLVRRCDRWLLRAAGLCVVSVLVHTLAVIAVMNGQWLLDPLVELRFVSVAPVALAATVVLMAATALLGRLRLDAAFWSRGISAGIVAGCMFLAVLELDENGDSFFTLAGMWMFWHLAMSLALCDCAKMSPPAPAAAARA